MLGAGTLPTLTTLNRSASSEDLDGPGRPTWSTTQMTRGPVGLAQCGLQAQLTAPPSSLAMSVSTTECLSSANDLLAAHKSLISRIRQTQQVYRRQLKTLPSPPHALLKLPLIPSPPRSPSPSPPSSPLVYSPPKPHRPDLPPAKRARVARYSNYVPEEETIRNDYSQRYVDGGEWPQNWVLGADPDHRFEE